MRGCPEPSVEHNLVVLLDTRAMDRTLLKTTLGFYGHGVRSGFAAPLQRTVGNGLEGTNPLPLAQAPCRPLRRALSPPLWPRERANRSALAFSSRFSILQQARLVDLLRHEARLLGSSCPPVKEPRDGCKFRVHLHCRRERGG